MNVNRISLRFVVEYWLLKLIRRILRSLSLSERRMLADITGNLVYFFLPYRRGTMRDNLQRAFPETTARWRRRIIRKCYVHFARVYFDFFPLYEASDTQLDAIVEYPDLDVLHNALARRRGVVLVSFHFGNWEVCGDWFRRHGYQIAAVAKKMKNHLVDEVILAARGQQDMPIFYKSKANSPRIWKYLRDENILYLLADQDARRDGIFVKFFGQWASSHRGPALFALRQKAPLIAASCLMNTKGKYVIRLKELNTEVPPENKNDPVTWLTQQIALYFEAQIRQYPEQYYWFHRRWKTKPPASFIEQNA
ncbi:MAG TPA: hypothetical protein P5268_02360 [Candidatus Marinimicrobia bacterium]|nr:hypothetical protein [Candidatus Neomarinimicrobiota bacterium]HRS52011.1 hypothetical protein [Candidatus Neomarinimicrobiota bacterium]HRU91860.1 hypothetical protein [Candidatus Neomarinimicrobiota bacterium]